ncbi:MAG: ribosome small subunit-dependent GTPase A [Candidatus Zambryskibacteria bacterium RIFOXYD1_FULL_40_13]|nr:MAG: ribosome small subunit-dependent GTPase A [Candidatus Zambryskibacteria bacterium GWB1_40_5]OHB16156.1 MAG: ribosome small subunit-dependent GTPase A [Candidatus Zambryskibacteria bacterium RIFOXYD1_FULL_40_13]
MKIEDLGYDAFFESSRKELGLGDFPVARVTVEHRGAYKVRNEKGEYLAKITGKQMLRAESRIDYPAVGDWVVITDLDGEHAVIRETLPRKTIIKRKHGDKSRTSEKSETQIIATNIDTAFVVESFGRDFSLNRFERYFALIGDGGIKPIIVLNKIDLISREELDLKFVEIKKRFDDVEVIPTSITNNNGIHELKKHIEKGKTYCFLGSSGVGKSSLINKLLGENMIKTEDVGSRTGRGKHVTTNRQMYFLENGGIVIDNPGMREVGMSLVGAGLDNLFDQITDLTVGCKFVDCTHIHEPGCAVLEALKAGDLDPEKYANYINLKKEVEYYEMTELNKREKDRQFGKFMKTYKKQSRKDV